MPPRWGAAVIRLTSVASYHTKGELREALTGNERGWLGTEEATIPWDFGAKSGTESSCSSFTCDASCLSWRGCSTNVLWTRAGAAMGQLSLPCSYLGVQVHKDGFPKCRDWKLEQGPRLSQCCGLTVSEVVSRPPQPPAWQDRAICAMDRAVRSGGEMAV